MAATNVVWHNSSIAREDREKQNGHKSAILWFTGLSGSGKSTLANAVEHRLNKLNAHTFILDGDNIRHGLCKDLSFSDIDRTENIRRIGEVSKLFIESGVLTLTAFISPFRADRAAIRELVKEGDFIEIYCQCALEICESRDVKGLYKKVRAGEIAEFTGITSPYEAPENPEISVNTGSDSLEECVDKVVAALIARSIVSK